MAVKSPKREMHRTRSSPAPAQAVHRGNSIRSRRGEDVAKLEGAVRAIRGCLILISPESASCFCPLRADFPHPWRGFIRRPNRPTGLNLFLGTVVFDQAQRQSFLWATYTGEGFTGTLQVGFPIGDSRRTPLNGDRSNVKSISEGYYVSICQARILGAAALLASKQRSASAGATRQHSKSARGAGNPLRKLPHRDGLAPHQGRSRV